ncbi:hypothetical protein M422DRAFT_275237 [Sphaerobolus stellatus SS14]|uniref:Uncharacterized protein n=1 Tax=Sphaerobolus stellatus (strain SS14) TaxID=990650 RepID=A0A0C9TQ66_SPHS4|nr:hypothetical protein M422DRAFT_275237 [Sphaerobolus stellatus SS14]
MTDLLLPTHILGWKTSDEVDCMEDIPVRHYWQACDQERTQHESRYQELLDAEWVAASCKRAEDATQAVREAQEKAKGKEKEKEKEKGKEKEKEKGKEKEAGPSRSTKGKGKEVPKTPKKPTPKKSSCEVPSESEEEMMMQTNPSPAYISSRRRRSHACPRTARRCLRQLEQKAAADSAAADTRVLQLLELKSKGVEIPVDLEKRVQVEHGLVQSTLKEHTEDITKWMDEIQAHMAWTKNGLPRISNDDSPP